MWEGRHLFATCSSGLSNRLLVLAGSLRIAQRTGRKLWLYWPLNNDLGTSFEELFTNKYDRVTDATMSPILDTAATVKVYNAWKTKELRSTAIRTDGDPDINVVIIKGWFYPMFDQEPYSAELLAEVRSNLLALRPVVDIQARLDSFPLPPRVIGVHVRRGDNMDEFGQSRDEHFFALMHELLRRDAALHFFLSTDSAECEERFRQEFGDSLLSTPKSWQPRSHSDNAREGLIDLLLLAKTGGILGTHRSSFSQTAAKIGDKLIVVANTASAHECLERSSETLINRLYVGQMSPALS